MKFDSGLKVKFLLVSILLLSFVLRFYKLGEVPSGLEWDEVAIGYDAYSILKTGKDQFGNFLPLTFRSLDDYKPPLYEYVSVPFIAIFGLNEFSTRFPSAFFGLLSVLMTYFLIKELTKTSSINKEAVSLIGSFLFAISPWHLQFSRATFEVNLSVFIIIAAVLFFLKGSEKAQYLVISAVFFGLALFSYHSTRVLTPILLTGLILFNYPKIDLKNKYLQASIGIYLIFFVFFLPILFSKDAQIRFSATNISNIFLDVEKNKELNVAQMVDNSSSNDFIFRLFHGRKPILLKLLIGNYLAHFNPQYLFINGDAALHHAPNFGLLYITEGVFIAIGFFVFLKKYLARNNIVILIWFFAAIIPSAVTLQVPHSVRTEIILPTFQIFSALGFYVIFLKLKNNIWVFKSIVIVSTLLFSYEILTYLHQYYVHTPYELSDKWMFGRKEAALYVDSIKHKYDRVIVSVKLEHPHIFFLYYLKYDPVRYLQEGGTYSGGWSVDMNKFDKYEFKYITYSELKEKYPNSLVVGLANEFPQGVEILKTIYYLDGKESIKIIKT